MEKQKLENIIEEINSQEFQHQTLEKFNETTFKLDKLNQLDSDIVRIEETVPFSWSGVRGCNDNERAQSVYKEVLTNWVKDKMFEHRNWEWVRYGATEANGRCHESRDRWTNERSCGCRGGLKCYIEFLKP